MKDGKMEPSDKTFTAAEMIELVNDYPDGCADQKENFLKTIGAVKEEPIVIELSKEHAWMLAKYMSATSWSPTSREFNQYKGLNEQHAMDFIYGVLNPLRDAGVNDIAQRPKG